MRRTRGFDHNDDDDDPVYSVDDITQDQFHVTYDHSQPQQRRGGGRYQASNPNNQAYSTNPHNTGSRTNAPVGAPQQHFDVDSKATVRSNAHYTDAAKFYDTLTQQNLSMADRQKSIILGVRNMNGWIKSIGINMAINHAQSHTAQLAKELGINLNEISVPNRFSNNSNTQFPTNSNNDNAIGGGAAGDGPGGRGRQIHSLFEMQQRSDGVWDLSINENYPLPLGTHLKLAGDEEYWASLEGQNGQNDQNGERAVFSTSTTSSTPLADGTTASHVGNNGSGTETSPRTFGPVLEQPLTNFAYSSGLQNPELFRNVRNTQAPNVYCLDLCGGKGGDLFKYTENHLGGYLLVDIAEKSVERAIDRFNECFDMSLRKNKNRKLFMAKFMVANLCYHSLHEFLHKRVSFDMCSISYSFHYAFETESTLRRMLQNISDRLRPGSCFVCTVPDARVLMNKLGSSNELTFGNDIYEFEFNPTPSLLSYLKSQNPATVHDYLHQLDMAQIRGNFDLLLWVKIHLSSTISDPYLNSLSLEEREAFDEFERNYHQVYGQNDQNHQNDQNGHNDQTHELDLPPLPYGHIPENIDHFIADRNQSTFVPAFTRPKQPPQNPFHSFSPFGIEYRFTLKEAVDNVPEFMVIYPVLCQIASEYGLKPLYYENAQTFVANHFQETLGEDPRSQRSKGPNGPTGPNGSPGDSDKPSYLKPHLNFHTDNRQLLQKLNVFDTGRNNWGSGGGGGGLDEPKPFAANQWEAVGVYCSMMFQKVGEIQFQGHTLYYDDVSLTQTFATAAASAGSAGKERVLRKSGLGGKDGRNDQLLDEIFGVYIDNRLPTQHASVSQQMEDMDGVGDVETFGQTNQNFQNESSYPGFDEKDALSQLVQETTRLTREFQTELSQHKAKCDSLIPLHPALERYNNMLVNLDGAREAIILNGQNDQNDQKDQNDQNSSPFPLRPLIHTNLSPDPAFASKHFPSDPFWSTGELTLGPIPLERMVNCFRDDLYDQAWTPTL